jgi:hypothetical protein
LRRAAIAIAIALAAVAALLVAPGGDAEAGRNGVAVYRGKGDQIRVEFRIQDDKIVRARLVATISCSGTRRGRAFRHLLTIRENATADGPIPVKDDGSFREGFLDEYGFIGEELPGVDRVDGRVGPQRVVGKFAVHYVDEVVEAEPPNRQTCQTGGFLPEPMKELRFRARRVR